jgi:hypothetical protein
MFYVRTIMRVNSSSLISKSFTCKLLSGEKLAYELGTISPTIHDENCTLVAFYVNGCMSHESDLINNVTLFGASFGCAPLHIGRNICFCLNRYKVNFLDFLSGCLWAGK